MNFLHIFFCRFRGNDADHRKSAIVRYCRWQRPQIGNCDCAALSRFWRTYLTASMSEVAESKRILDVSFDMHWSHITPPADCHATVMSLLCRYHVTVMSLSYHCHATVTSLSCHCYVTVRSQSCRYQDTVMTLSYHGHIIVMSLS